MALLLQQRGVTRVRPLAGGLQAWKERNYPLAPLGSKKGDWEEAAAITGQVVNVDGGLVFF